MNINEDRNHENRNNVPLLAQVISTGDEVLTGVVADSNAAYISAALLENGVRVVRLTTVGDDAERLRDLLKELGRQADIAVVTGGLGPTVDDITAEAAADAANVGLVQNHDALSSIEDYFKRLNRPMNASDHKQAMLPENSTMLFNPAGTAPGFTMKIDRCTFFFLPGVPREMKVMLKDCVIPIIQKDHIPKRQQLRYREKQISLFGLPEAAVNERLVLPSKQFKNVKLGMLARFPIIIVKLFAHGSDENEIEHEIDNASRLVHETLGEWIFSSTGGTMEAAIGKILALKNLTVAVAESCTGGRISDLLTNVAGCSDYFLMSAVTYANDSKKQILGVLPETINAHGAVSEETAREMAVGIKRISGADYGVSTSGVAGPSGGTDEKPVGTICVAVAGPNRVISKRRVLSFNYRTANKDIFAHFALDMLRRELLT
jgi:nicotinamide-nucleotide amidase